MMHLSPEILDDYAGGRLKPEDRRAAEAHLATCPACRQTVTGLTQIDALLRTTPRVAPPSDLAARIITRLEPALPPRQTIILSSPATPNWAKVTWYGLGVVLAWAWLIILGGETVLAASRGGLGELAWFFQAHPEVIVHYPVEAVYALLETVPVLELGLTGMVLLLALWLMQRFVATLPIGSHA